LEGDSADCIPRAIGGMPDHMHVVISIPPQLSIAALIVQLKGASLHHVNEKYADGSFQWQAEYGVLSFSESSLPAIVDYVDGQKQHHAADTLIREMESS
jgi:putative transposase